jgi:outer membrane immunogenic protein
MASIKTLLAPAVLSAAAVSSAHAAQMDPALQKLLGIYGTPHSEFAGPYVAAKFGIDWSDITGPHARSYHSTWYPSVALGVNYDVDQFVIGVEAFADFHGGSTTGDDKGMDLKVGLPVRKDVMPYLRVGFTGSSPDNRLHYGAGVEYKMHKNWSVAAEYTGDKSSYQNGHRHNQSVTMGVRYYFF